ncbi:MAG: hypothetical protein DA408_04075 [Bacteroidetes bacterium]|nr:MAG: hypothetical protein C7N36_05980 [Bacteroidota bacterium]PTM14075.1 MAG: hypothetical protein DA408_04075 [Bacteroidota bacterium]
MGESNFTINKMGTILESRAFMPPEDVAAYFKGKIIFLGDFKHDFHETPFGKTAGPLVIYNAYLTLAGRENIVSFFWILLLFIGFWLISWRIFNDINVERGWLVDLFHSKIGQLIINSLDELMLLIILTVISYFIFNIHINILILLVYTKVVEFLWKKTRFYNLVIFKKT